MKRSLKKYIKQNNVRECIAGYTFLSLPILLKGIFVFFPIFYAFVLSFYDWELLVPDKPWVGLANYVELLRDPIFWIAVKNTIVYTAGVVPVQTFIALLLAVILNQNIKGRPFYRVAFYIPCITSSVVTSIIFLWIYSKLGLLNYLIHFIGISGPDWLADPHWALSSIMMLNVWTTSGFFMVAFLAALQSIPKVLYEAAKVDGANRWQTFWRITVPMLRPATFFVVTLGLIGCFQVFDQIYVMSSGGPANATTTMSYFIYKNAFQYFRMGYASAASVVLFIIILIFTLTQKKFMQVEVD